MKNGGVGAWVVWMGIVGMGCGPHERADSPRGTAGASGTVDSKFGGGGAQASGVGGGAFGGAGVQQCGADVVGGIFMAVRSPQAPQFGATVTPAVPPPAISGGTLRILRDGHTAVASDPDRDQVYAVDLTAAKVRFTISLMKGDEPGRVVEDAAARLHVALRAGGAVVTVDATTGAIVSRRAVCAAPRGLAYDARTDLIHVACTDGQLISLPAAGGGAVRTLRLDRDLRDVVVDGDSLLVSRFRSAQVLTISAAGAVERRLTPAPFQSDEVHSNQLFSASVAWRMVEMPGGGAAMVHQRGMEDLVISDAGGYAGVSPCDAIVHTAVTVLKKDQVPAWTPTIPGMVLATDLAVSADGKRVAVIATGNAYNGAQPGLSPNMPRVFVTEMRSLLDQTVGCRADGVHGPCMTNGSGRDSSGTGGASGAGGTSDIGGASGATEDTTVALIIGPDPTNNCDSIEPPPGVPEVVGEPVAVAFDGRGDVVVQTREPAALLLGSRGKVVLSNTSRADTGHAVFHSNAGGGMACASCHPEGTEDGRIWNFSCEGKRRTQSLNGGIASTAPFHWSGDMKDFSQLMGNVFVQRMAGPLLAPEQVEATLNWIDRQPRVPAAPAANPAAVARGRGLFSDPTGAACATCHSGAQFTNSLSADVGTGGLFQVPSLIGVSARPPFMHNGCAKTLGDRFSTACGGGDKHGMVSRLSVGQIADLIAFMETL